MPKTLEEYIEQIDEMAENPNEGYNHNRISIILRTIARLYGKSEANKIVVNLKLSERVGIQPENADADTIAHEIIKLTNMSVDNFVIEETDMDNCFLFKVRNAPRALTGYIIASSKIIINVKDAIFEYNNKKFPMSNPDSLQLAARYIKNV